SPHPRRLTPPGRDAPPHFIPEQRADLITHEAVQNAAGLLGIEQFLVEFLWMLQGLFHRAFGDFVEKDPMNSLLLPSLLWTVFRLRFLRFLRLFGWTADLLGNMPGDGFPFPIGIGGEIHSLGARGRFLYLVDHLLLSLDDFIGRAKVVLQIHAQGSDGKVLYMPDGGLDRKILS